MNIDLPKQSILEVTLNFKSEELKERKPPTDLESLHKEEKSFSWY
jgi:hypothetical protein